MHDFSSMLDIFTQKGLYRPAAKLHFVLLFYDTHLLRHQIHNHFTNGNVHVTALQ